MSRLSPQEIAAALQQALTLHQQSRLAEAEKAYNRVLKARPGQFDALHLLGVLKLQDGKAGEALRLVSAALKVDPRAADAWANLGLVQKALKREADALASFDQALALAPGHIEALNNRGSTLLSLQRADEALACFDRVLGANPRYLPALVNRANALVELARHDEALGEYDMALALNPNDVQALFNRANVLFRVGRYAELVMGYDRVLALAPGHAEAHMSRGLSLQALGRHQAALASYAKAVALQKDYADAHFNAALARLTLGDYAAGFAGYEWRWKRAGITRRSFAKPLWLGEYPIARKTILLHAEQGLGDTIQFVRYAPLLARAGATVVLELQSPLKSLLGTVEGASAVVARGEALPAFDVHCPLGSLPLALKTDLASVPAGIPYLQAVEERIEKWRARIASTRGPRVAVAWSGNAAHINDRNRSIALAALQPILATPGVQFFSVQRDLRAGDAEALQRLPQVIHLGEELADFADTAAVVAQADLVVAVDTAVAHLAGAMGRPLWILLPFWPDWRWTLTGERSPWYPDARLFRQRAPGRWDDVIGEVAEALAAFAQVS